MSYCVQVIRCFLHNICNISVLGRRWACSRELPVCRPRPGQAVLGQSALLRSPQCCHQITRLWHTWCLRFFGHSALWTELSRTWVLVFFPWLTSEHDLWQINDSLNLCKMRRESMRRLSSWAFRRSHSDVHLFCVVTQIEIKSLSPTSSSGIESCVPPSRALSWYESPWSEAWIVVLFNDVNHS